MTKKIVPYNAEKERAALVVVDMQNDFVQVGGSLEIADARTKIPAIIKLIKESRKLDLPVIFIKFIGSPNKTIIWNWSPAISPPTKCCWKNHKRYYPELKKELYVADIIPELPVKPEDYIVEKYSYGAFYNTNLEDVLRALNKNQIIVCGAAMPICINDTVTGAFERQFEVLLAEDASASFSEEYRKFSLQLINFKYGRVLSSEEILKDLKE